MMNGLKCCAQSCSVSSWLMPSHCCQRMTCSALWNAWISPALLVFPHGGVHEVEDEDRVHPGPPVERAAVLQPARAAGKGLTPETVFMRLQPPALDDRVTTADRPGLRLGPGCSNRCSVVSSVEASSDFCLRCPIVKDGAPRLLTISVHRNQRSPAAIACALLTAQGCKKSTSAPSCTPRPLKERGST